MATKRMPEGTTERMLQLRADGLGNYQIAERMGCTHQTVYDRIGAKKPHGPRKRNLDSIPDDTVEHSER